MKTIKTAKGDGHGMAIIQQKNEINNRLTKSCEVRFFTTSASVMSPFTKPFLELKSKLSASLLLTQLSHLRATLPFFFLSSGLLLLPKKKKKRFSHLFANCRKPLLLRISEILNVQYRSVFTTPLGHLQVAMLDKFSDTSALHKEITCFLTPTMASIWEEAASHSFCSTMTGC